LGVGWGGGGGGSKMCSQAFISLNYSWEPLSFPNLLTLKDVGMMGFFSII